MAIAIDLNGGDHGAREIIRGVKLALKLGYVLPNQLLLFGDESAVRLVAKDKELKHVNYRLCAEVIGMGDKITHSDRRRDCSLVNGIIAIRDGECQAFVSAGNTAAIVSLAVMLLGRINRKVLPAMAVILPSEQGHCLLIDIGANANSEAADLLHNAKMGCIYAREVLGVESPRIGLLNIGEELGKGHKTINTAHELLGKSGLNFVGYVEGNDIFKGTADVVVTDGFTGNVVIKSSEGLVKMIFDFAKNEFGDSYLFYLSLPFLFFASLILYTKIQSFRAKLDYNEYGGALLLGVSGNVIIAHGRSKRKAIAQAIRAATAEVELNILSLIMEEFSKK